VWLLVLLGVAGLYAGMIVAFARLYVSPPRVVEHPGRGLSIVEAPGPGYPLSVWTNQRPIPAEGPVFVLVHGFGGSAACWTPMLHHLGHKGFAAFAPEMRAHGRSRARHVTFGPGEAREVLAVARWIRGRSPGARIVLAGISLGGAACWIAAAENPADVHAVASEGAFARLAPVADRVLGRAMPGGAVLLAPVRWLGRRWTGVDPREVNPVEAARAWRGRPALVIHGERDRLIDPGNAEALAEASGAQLWIVPGASHAQVMILELEEYARRLVALGEPAPAP
jgi:pimeloyl-ACP methyl ester carboxylesterase